MKFYNQALNIISDEKEQFFNLTYEIEECVRRSCINEGLCVVISQHTTASVFLEHDDENLYNDWARLLSSLANGETEYTVDYQSAGLPHLKQLLAGGSVTVPISSGKLDLGPRQYIMFGDFDGKREKSVFVKIIGE